MEWIKHIYLHTYIVSLTIPVGVVYLRRLSLSAKLILFLAITNVCIDILATYINRGLGMSTHLLYNIYVFFEFLFVITLYGITQQKETRKWGIHKWILPFFVSFCCLIFITEGIIIFNPINYTVGGFIVSIMAYSFIRGNIVIDNLKSSDIMIWFSVANIIFYLVSIPVISLSPLSKIMSDELYKNILVVKNTAYILWAVLIGFGFICQKMKTISYL